MGKKYRRRFSRVVYLLDQTATEISKNDEMRLVRAFNDEYPYRNRPPWILHVRHATLGEERLKIDVIFETSDVGDIHVQVKGSNFRIKLFKDEQSRGEADSRIIPFVMRPRYDAKVIVNRLLPLVSLEHRTRIRLLEKKSVAHS